MNSVRAGQPGATRLCPHCKATVLESATICPGCRHHLRFNGGKQLAAGEAYTALSVVGSIAHRQRAEPCEYCIVLEITNERGEQILRQVVGVGALQSGEQRRLNVTVDMLPLVAAPARPSTPAASVSSGTASGTATPAVREPLRPGLAAARAPAAATRAPAAATRAAPGIAAPSAAAAPASPAAAAAARAAPAPTAAPAPAAGKDARAAAAPVKPSGAAPTAGAIPNPGATLGQRLRIFRKP
jgi:hypothetical protein